MANPALQLNGSIKHFVLEQQKLHSKIQAGERRALLRTGGLLRKIAQRSIRPGGKKHKRSEPGQPIRWHVKPGFRGNIWFAYDPRTRSLVVGPSAVRNSPVPEVLEEGGFITMKVREHGKVVRKRVYIRKRPTMKLALDAGLPQIPSQFKDTIR